MDYFDKSFCIEVWGDFACFTRPEMKVERVSYDVITPSAARGIFQSIFWKPAIEWRIEKIEILNPIKWFSIRRNETAKLMSPQKNGIFIEDDNIRQQKSALLLREVRYRLHAKQEFIPPSKRIKVIKPLPEYLMEEEEIVLSKKDENPGKYHAIFERRAKKGKCFSQPYLGCREFSCNFCFVEEGDLKTETIKETRDLGFMLYDMDYSDPQNIIPMFFRAVIKDGIIYVPPVESGDVYK